MEELNRRLTYLFSLVGLLVCLGKFDRQVETYVLTDTGLILRQDAVNISPDINYAQELLEPNELTPASTEPKELKNEDRTPASAISLHVPKLGIKRKPRTMIAQDDTAISADSQIERSQKLDIDTGVMTSMLAKLPQDSEALAQIPEVERMIALDLFEDTSFNAIVDQIRPTVNGGFELQGHVAGLADGTFHMVQENGETVANIFSSAAQYEVRAEAGTHVVHQINPMKIPSSAVLASATTPQAVLPSSKTPTSASAIQPASVAKATSICNLKLQSPNGKEVLSQSLGEKVLWASENAGREIRIKLLKGDQDLGTIARATNDGSTLVRIPALIDPDADYRIRIESSDDPTCFDESDEAFSIVP